MSKGRVLIVGAGIAGLSVAWGLTRRGFEVTVFDQGPIPNPRGASHDEHRITRHAYGTAEGYAYLMPQAFEAYAALWRDIGADHHERSSAIYFLRGDNPWYGGTARSLAAMGIGYRDLDLSDVRRRFPMVETTGLTRAVETDEAGMLFPICILTDLVVALAARGVRFHSDALVSAVDPERGTLDANGVRHEGDVVIVAAGAWAPKLVPSLKGVAVPSRQVIIYLAPPPELAAAWAEAPVLVDIGDRITYTLPPRRGTRLKVGDHHFSRGGDPDGDRMATTHDLAGVLRGARQAYVGFDRYSILERKICFYTVTEDEHFIVEPIGPRGWVSSPCSGHGFKLGALIGDGVAAAVAGEAAPDRVTRWAAGLLPLGDNRLTAV